LRIVKVLEISYAAAAKALPMARKRIASVVMVENPGAEKSSKPKILSLKPW
jgi:hypothetical protein